MNKKKNFILLGLIVFVFVTSLYPVFIKIYARWNNGDNNYCYLIVPLVTYLLWDKREKFRFGEPSWNILGIVPLFLSLIMMVLGEVGSVETFLYLGLWGCIISMFFVFYGRRIKILAFPLFLMIFIVPLPPFINRMLTFQLKLAASIFAVSMLRLIGASVFREGNIIDLGTTQLQVVDACSGLRYVMPMIVMALVIGYLFINGWWRRGFLLAVVPPLSILVNAFRIFVAGLLHLNGYPELAEDFFHDFSGWLVFMIAGVLLVAIAFILNRIGAEHKPTKSRDPGGSAAGNWQPIAVTLTVSLLFVGTGWAIQKFPSAHNLPQRLEFSDFPMRIGDWSGRKHLISREILDELWADDYLSATFQHVDFNYRIQVLIPFYEYQGTRHTAHAPQSCLLGGGWTLLETKKHTVRVNDKQEISIRSMHLRKGDLKLLGTYFFLQRGRVLTNPWMNKFFLIYDSITRLRTDGALVRIEVVVPPDQSIEQAYRIIDEFIVNIYGVLHDYVPM
jgi:exosortase D (VPLPA-CTERM-specific)